MSDNRTTERLRKLLDERGIKWKNIGGTTSGDGITEWLVDGMTCQAAQRVTVGIEHLALYIPVLTPKQAIAATLGSGTLTAEQVREAIEANSWAETSTIREFNDSSWQAIADELNARAERTCRMEYQTGSDNPLRGWWLCDQCGGLSDSVGDGWDGKKQRMRPPAYCARCGAKVVDA